MLPGAEMLFGGAKVSSKSYVKHGLIGMWDGIENVGFGKHSGNTLVWNNLGSLGSAYDATRVAQPTWWVDNGAVFHHKSSGLLFNIPGYFMRDIMGSEWSYELVFTPGEKWMQNVAWSGIFGNHGSGKGICGGQVGANGPDKVAFTLYDPGVPLWVASISENFALGQIASVSQSASNSRHSAMTYKDGVSVAVANDVDVELTYHNEGTYIGGAYFAEDGGRTFDGVIHCVRVYNRPITTSEVAKNHAVDVKRFGGFA
jgi:hypothetical protein